MAKRIRLTFDWTPNNVHTGFFVAASKGWYENAGIDVHFKMGEEPEDLASPIDQLTAEKADIAITSSEDIVLQHLQQHTPPAIAIAAVLAKDASAIVTLAKDEIYNPAQLDSKIYASGQRPLEEQIMRQMVVNDGGTGDVNIIRPGREHCWDVCLSGAANAARILLLWEGVEARLKGMDLNTFQLNDFNIPYGYNPVLAALPAYIQDESKTIKAFLQATARGYQFAKNDPLEAASILKAQLPHLENISLNYLQQSQIFASQYYMDEQGNWGIMQIKIWEQFVGWLLKQELLKDISEAPIEQLNVYQLFSNAFFE